MTQDKPENPDPHSQESLRSSDLGRDRKEFHFLEATAGSLSLQVQVMHQKQSIMFSLSAGMIAVLFYTGQPWWAVLPFFLGLMTALISILPAISIFSGGVSFARNPFHFGTIPENIKEIDDLTLHQYAQLYLMNLQQLTGIITYKNKLIIASAALFGIGTFILMILSALGLISGRV